MARRPARLERAGALTPRDRMWAAIRALSQVSLDVTASFFSSAEVHFLANLRAEHPVHIDSVATYLEGLAKAEPPYLQLMDGDRPAGRKRSELALYQLVRDVGVEAPRVTADGKPVTQGVANEQMWLAMKALREFDTAELALCASQGGVKVSEETAKTYARFLERAGYLALVCAAKPGQAKARYRFNRAKNTGPRAPLICKDKSVMDANTGETVWTLKGEKGCKQPT